MEESRIAHNNSGGSPTVEAEHEEMFQLLRRIVVRDGLNDCQWFWLDDCKKLLARIEETKK